MIVKVEMAVGKTKLHVRLWENPVPSTRRRHPLWHRTLSNCAYVIGILLGQWLRGGLLLRSPHGNRTAAKTQPWRRVAEGGRSVAPQQTLTKRRSLSVRIHKVTLLTTEQWLTDGLTSEMNNLHRDWEGKGCTCAPWNLSSSFSPITTLSTAVFFFFYLRTVSCHMSKLLQTFTPFLPWGIIAAAAKAKIHSIALQWAKLSSLKWKGK